MLLEISEVNVRFLASRNYVNGNVYDLAEQFNIKYEREFFPEKFISSKNYDYVGSIPSIDHYLSFNDSPKIKTEIESFLRKKNVIYGILKKACF